MKKAILAAVIFLILTGLGVVGFVIIRNLNINAFTSTGIFLSQDGGDKWNLLNKKLPDGTLKNRSFLSLDIGPEIFVGTRGDGLYKKEKGGFKKVEDSNGVLGKRANIYEISFDPFNKSIIYLASFQDGRGQVLRSLDGGSSFERVYVTARPDFAVFDLALDKTRKGILYIGTAEGLLLKSIDRGESWQKIKLFNGVVSEVNLDPFNQNRIYVTLANKGLWRSNDGGSSWQDITSGLRLFSGASDIKRLIFDDNVAGTIYIGTSFGVLRSRDEGNSWEELSLIIPPEALPVFALDTNPKNSNNIIVGAGSQIFQSFDGGKNWQVRQMPVSGRLERIIFNRLRQGEIYAIFHKR